MSEAKVTLEEGKKILSDLQDLTLQLHLLEVVKKLRAYAHYGD